MREAIEHRVDMLEDQQAQRKAKKKRRTKR